MPRADCRCVRGCTRRTTVVPTAIACPTGASCSSALPGRPCGLRPAAVVTSSREVSSGRRQWRAPGGSGTTMTHQRQPHTVSEVQPCGRVAGISRSSAQVLKAGELPGDRLRQRVELGWPVLGDDGDPPVRRPRYARRSEHACRTCSGTASNSRGFSCITYSFSM